MAGDTWVGKAVRYVVDSYLYGTKSLSKTRDRAKFVNTFLDRLGKSNQGYVNTGEVSEMLKLALVSSWVYADVQLISNRISASPMFTLEKPVTKKKAKAGQTDEPDDTEETDDIQIRKVGTGKVSKSYKAETGAPETPEVIEEHAILDLWNTPNSLMSGNFMKRYICLWYLLMGNAFIYMVPTTVSKGPIMELWPLPTLSVRPDVENQRISNKSGKPIIDYIYNAQGEEIILPGENVIHFRTPNTQDYWVGMSQLTALQLPVRTDYSEAYWLDTFFGQDNAIPAALISLPPELGEVDFETVKRDLKDQFSGGRRTGITRAGQISVEVIQHAISEMRVLEGRAFNQKEIDRVYNVPDSIFTASSGDSQLAGEIALGRNALQPMLNIMVEEIAAKLMPWYVGEEASFKMEPYNIVPNDQRLDLEVYNSYKNELTINENRAKQDEPPITFSETFKDLQPLLDEIPVFMYPDLASIIIAKWQKVFDPPPPPMSPFSFGGFGEDTGFGNTDQQNMINDQQNGGGLDNTDLEAGASAVDKGKELGSKLVAQGMQKGMTPDQIASIKMAVYRQVEHTNGFHK